MNKSGSHETRQDMIQAHVRHSLTQQLFNVKT